MLVSPNNTQFGYAVRFSVVAFSAAVLFYVITQSSDQSVLAVYMALLVILMIFAQKATNYSLSDGKIGSSGEWKRPSQLDILLIYIVSLSIIFARSILTINVPNPIYFAADIVAIGSAIFGFAVTYRREQS